MRRSLLIQLSFARTAQVLVSALMIAAAAPTAVGSGSRLDDDGAINSGKETHLHDDAQHGVSAPPTD